MLAGLEDLDCERIKVFKVNFPYIIVSLFVFSVLIKLLFDKRVDFLNIGLSGVNTALPLVDIVFCW